MRLYSFSPFFEFRTCHLPILGVMISSSFHQDGLVVKGKLVYVSSCWSEKMKRQLTDLFSYLADLAKSIVSFIHPFVCSICRSLNLNLCLLPLSAPPRHSNNRARHLRRRAIRNGRQHAQRGRYHRVWKTNKDSKCNRRTSTTSIRHVVRPNQSKHYQQWTKFRQWWYAKYERRRDAYEWKC